MNLQFPNILNEDCKLICWCFPVELTKDKWEEIRNRFPAQKLKTEIWLKEILSIEKNKLQYRVHERLLRISKEDEYVCEFRIEKVKSKESITESTKSEISELFKFISKVLKKKTHIVVCGVYKYDLTKVRPIFEIPFTFPGTGSQKTNLGEGQVTGLTLNFKQSALGLKEAFLGIDEEENKLEIGIHCTGEFVVEPKMPIKITSHLKSVSQLFVEEVKK